MSTIYKDTFLKGGDKIFMKTAQKGFTLVELLVVIAIIAILAAVVVLIVNPAEILKEGRDATRLSDMANLQQAINVAAQTTGFAYCNAGAIPADPTPCVFDSVAKGQAADGTGWVRANLAAQTTVKVPALPVDPSNTGTFIYKYCGTDAAGAAGWELNANLESTKYQPKMNNDGGNLSSTGTPPVYTNARYEVGSNLAICP